MGLISKFTEHGFIGSAKMGWSRLILRPYHSLRCRNVPIYKNPTFDELMQIEESLASLGITVIPASLSVEELEQFKDTFEFPIDYSESKKGGVLDEKILEHFIAYKYCNLENFKKEDVYVDVAGAGSPWAKILREQKFKAYCIDLNIIKKYQGLDFYIQSDAKATQFENSSVAACSLQCAYEMFSGDDDWLFLDECKRILQPGGKVVISPLYMHTHHCGYSTPEHYGKGYSDVGAKEYIRKDCFNIPFSRKYSPILLKERILDYIEKIGMKYELFRIDNKEKLGHAIYCHFVLVITKNQPVKNSV